MFCIGEASVSSSSFDNILQSKRWLPHGIICFGDGAEVFDKLDHNLMRFLSIKIVQFCYRTLLKFISV